MGQLKHGLRLILLLVLLTGGRTLYAQDPVAYLFQQINTLRESLGLPAYLYNIHLAAAAQAHSDDMAAQQYVTHQGSDGLLAPERALVAGYPAGGIVSENIYGGMGGPDSAFNWWLGSPVHYEQLTTTYFAEIGIGVTAGEDGWTYYTLVFGMPPGGPPTVTPVPPTLTPTLTPTATPTRQPPTAQPSPPAVTLPAVTVVVVAPLGSTVTPPADATVEPGPSATPTLADEPPAISGAIGTLCVMLVGVFSVGAALWIWWRSS